MSSTLGDVHALLYALLCGALLGLVYDVLLLFRTGGKWVNVCFDALFWLVALVVCVVMFVRANYLQPRLYLAVGLAVGAAAYFYSLSVGVRKVCQAVRNAIVRVVNELLYYLE